MLNTHITLRKRNHIKTSRSTVGEGLGACENKKQPRRAGKPTTETITGEHTQKKERAEKRITGRQKNKPMQATGTTTKAIQNKTKQNKTRTAAKQKYQSWRNQVTDRQKQKQKQITGGHTKTKTKTKIKQKNA